MIIVSLFGGLGNQMFQYACGKAVALDLGVELKLDISHLSDRTFRKYFTYRDYELDIFSLSDEIAGEQLVRRFIPDLWNSPEWKKQTYRFRRLFERTHLFYERKKFTFEPQILNVKDNTYLYGYFQTEKYFSRHAGEIRNMFALNHEPDAVNKTIMEKMSRENSVSIHVRRGDYLLTAFNLLDAGNYYRSAVEMISERVSQPKFYIFTNDLEWTKQEFASFDIDKTFVSNNQGDQSYMDMILMSRCRHNICANSSFSWWGAWLNPHPDKVIVAPANWFNEPGKVGSFDELIPESWIKV